MKLTYVAVICLLGLAIQGCVSAATHNKLQDQYDQVSKDLNECGTKLESADKKTQEQEVVIKELESKLGTTASAKTKLEGNVAEMKAALEAQSKQRAEAEKRINEFKNLVQKFKALTDTGKLTIKIVDGKMVVALSSDVLFPPGSAKLSDNGVKSIGDVTQLLASVPNRKFQIEGHTDNKPIKVQFPSNWELAEARSMTVLKTMLSSGMPPNRISAASFGETKPVKSNDTEEGRAANRRIEIVVVPDLSTLPGYEELQKISNQ